MSPGCGLFHSDFAPIHKGPGGLTDWLDEGGNGKISPEIKTNEYLGKILC